MKNSLFSIFMICGSLLLIGSFTSALFSDAQSIPNNEITTGIWNPGKATITEVLYNPAGSTELGREWIDITNTGGYDLNMTGYVLRYSGVGTNDYIFPSYTLKYDSKVRVHVRLTGTNTENDLYWNC